MYSFTCVERKVPVHSRQQFFDVLSDILLGVQHKNAKQLGRTDSDIGEPVA